MTVDAINTDKAPAAIGPYSQAIVAGGFVYVSGQIPLNPKTGELVAGDIEAQTRQVFANIKNVAAAAGCGLQDCVKLNISMLDLGGFDTVNKVMMEVFEKPYPARAFQTLPSLPC